MRKMAGGLMAALALGLTGGAWAAPDASEQLQYESFVVAAGASNGAARACGASEPDLKQHQDTSRKNLQRYAQEYGFNAQNYDTLFDKGLDQGKAMMEEMKRSGVDGCRGVLGSFQNERVIGYEDMKAALAEVSDGLPGKPRNRTEARFAPSLGANLKRKKARRPRAAALAYSPFCLNQSSMRCQA